MLQLSSVPRLARKARLRFDPIDGCMLLLAPERGLILSETAAAVLTRCTGQRTLGEIISELSDHHDAPQSQVRDDVISFLHALVARGLLTADPSAAPPGT